jgi:hypothetical protein
LMSGLDWPGAITDVKACAAWLKANGCNKVVVAGFCMGGALALGSTVQVDGVDACIAFYGWNKQLGDVSTVKSHPFCVCGAPRSCPCSNVRVNLCGDEEGRVGIETRTWLGWRELNCIHFTQCGGGVRVRFPDCNRAPCRCRSRSPCSATLETRTISLASAMLPPLRNSRGFSSSRVVISSFTATPLRLAHFLSYFSKRVHTSS